MILVALFQSYAIGLAPRMSFQFRPTAKSVLDASIASIWISRKFESLKLRVANELFVFHESLDLEIKN